ncbi:uncharacterized protein J5F26_010194 [Ciconia maguari]
MAPCAHTMLLLLLSPLLLQSGPGAERHCHRGSEELTGPQNNRNPQPRDFRASKKRAAPPPEIEGVGLKGLADAEPQAGESARSPETPRPPHVRGAGGRSARRARRVSAAPVRPLGRRRPPGARCRRRRVAEGGTAASAPHRFVADRGTAARPPHAGSGPSGAPWRPAHARCPGATWRRRQVRAEGTGEANEPLRRVRGCLPPAGRPGVAGRGASNRSLRQAPGLLESCSPRSPPSPVVTAASWPSVRLQKPLRKDGIRPGRATVKDSQVTGVTEWEGRKKEKEVSELANSPSSAKSKSCGGGQPSDRSYRIGREERRRKKCLNSQILLAAPRARAAPMEVHGGADMHLQPVEDPTPQQVDVPEESCDPVESLRWNRLLSAPVVP